jgi:hypothetical protein
MKNFFFNFVTLFLTILIVGTGIYFFSIFINEDFGLIPLIFGIIGYSISVRPAINEWLTQIKKWFVLEKEENDIN